METLDETMARVTREFHEKAVMQSIDDLRGRVALRDVTGGKRGSKHRRAAIERLLERGVLTLEVEQTGGRPKTWLVLVD